MPKIVVHENEYARLWYHPETRIIHHEFLKPISGQAFKTVLSEGLEVMRKEGATKWLSDDRANSILPAEDSDWSSNIWRPQAVKAGWKYWALVLPLNRLGQINMERITREVAQNGVGVKFFTQPGEALAWLEAQ